MHAKGFDYGTEKSTLWSWCFNYDSNPFEVLVTTFPQYDDVTDYFVMSKMYFGKYQTDIAFSPRKLIQEKQKSKNRAEAKQYLILHVWWMPTKSSDFITNDISTVCDIRGASLITSAIIGKLAQTRFGIQHLGQKCTVIVLQTFLC